MPDPDPISAPFWDGVNRGTLLVQRCAECNTLQFPFAATCEACSSSAVTPYEVSGKGTVFSFTETTTGARHPYFQAISPYLVGQVQLSEQEDLIFMSNFPGSTYDDLRVGAPVEVEFQKIGDVATIPQFRVTGAPVARH
jgi:uncharacterized OB-fold protein